MRLLRVKVRVCVSTRPERQQLQLQRQQRAGFKRTLASSLAILFIITALNLLEANGSLKFVKGGTTMGKGIFSFTSGVVSSTMLKFEDDDDNNERDNNLPLCNMEQLKNGSWKSHRLPKPPYNPVTERHPVTSGHNGLSNAQFFCYGENGPNMTAPFDTYLWEATSVTDGTCRFPQGKFPNDFCKLTYNKTVAFVGDSITLEQFEDMAFHSGLIGHDISTFVWDKKNTYSNFITTTCPHNKTTIVYRRTFWMEVVNAFLEEVFPDIMVLNTGAWYKPDRDLLNAIERRYDAIRKWKNKCEEIGRDCHVIWRTTVPGHPYCTQYKKPATSVEEMERLVANLSWYPIRNGIPQTNWWNFKHQNSLALDSLNRSGIGFDVIPSYNMLILRPDVHRKLTPAGDPDCYHACLLDGSVTLVNELFLQLLRVRKQKLING